MCRRIFVGMLLAALSTVAHSQGDRVFLEPRCPNVEVTPGEGVGLAVASAVLPRLVGGSLNALSARLSEAATPEETVSIAAGGGHLYQYAVAKSDSSTLYFVDSGQLAFAYGCIIYASAPIGTNQEWPNEKHNCNGPESPRNSPLRRYGLDGIETCALLTYLDTKGYDPEYPPRTLLIANVEESNDGTAFRLVPYYFFYATSPNDSRRVTSARRRSVAFNFAFSRPDPNDPSGRQIFATPILEFQDIVSGIVERNTNGESSDEISIYESTLVEDYKSQWFAVPEPSDSFGSLIAVDQSAYSLVQSNLGSAKRANSRGLDHQESVDAFTWNNTDSQSCQNVSFDYYIDSPLPRIDQVCPDLVEPDWSTILLKNQTDAWAMEQQRSRLEDELRHEANEDRKSQLRKQINQCNIAKTSADLAAGVAAACNQISESSTERGNLQALLTRGEPVDVSVVVVENHEKPFLKLFSDILADESLRTEVTDVLTSSISPTERAEATLARAEERQAAIETYETAVVTAQKLELDYEAIDGVEEPLRKGTVEIDVRIAKLKANRMATDLNIALPFPSVGVQF